MLRLVVLLFVCVGVFLVVVLCCLVWFGVLWCWCVVCVADVDCVLFCVGVWCSVCGLF